MVFSPNPIRTGSSEIQVKTGNDTFVIDGIITELARVDSVLVVICLNGAVFYIYGNVIPFEFIAVEYIPSAMQSNLFLIFLTITNGE
jgi:hypothetical protein